MIRSKIEFNISNFVHPLFSEDNVIYLVLTAPKIERKPEQMRGDRGWIARPLILNPKPRTRRAVEDSTQKVILLIHVQIKALCPVSFCRALSVILSALTNNRMLHSRALRPFVLHCVSLEHWIRVEQCGRDKSFTENRSYAALPVRWH